jgi:hypothetical protein
MLDGRKYEIFLEMQQHNGMIFVYIFYRSSSQPLSCSVLPHQKAYRGSHREVPNILEVCIKWRLPFDFAFSWEVIPSAIGLMGAGR